MPNSIPLHPLVTTITPIIKNDWVIPARVKVHVGKLTILDEYVQVGWKSNSGKVLATNMLMDEAKKCLNNKELFAALLVI